jgi:7-cyano-7-deazaguanine synthase in queuosine biosynthesis
MIRPAYRLTVTTKHADGADLAVLGRDIRSKPHEIARYCLAQHRAINEDVATIAESVALADRIFSRHRGATWARLIEIEIPVFNVAHFDRADLQEALAHALHFLTGDTWRIGFVPRDDAPPSENILPFEEIRYRYVMPYSDGLDSFSLSRFLEREVGTQNLFKLRSARIGQDSEDLRKPVLRVPRSLGSLPKPEQTYRTRPFVFFSFAGIGAFVSAAEAVVVGETGQGALGPALIRYADEWPFRSTHPGFLSRMASYLSYAFNADIRIEMPHLWSTKGEVLARLKEEGLLGKWAETSSCSVRPANKHGAGACGVCGGCMLRTLATHTAGISPLNADIAFDVRSTHVRASDGEPMSDSERQMAVRSIGSMVEFGRLNETAVGRSLIDSESRLFGNADAESVPARINDLVLRHACELRGFVDSMPAKSWARSFAEQL